MLWQTLACQALLCVAGIKELVSNHLPDVVGAAVGSSRSPPRRIKADLVTLCLMRLTDWATVCEGHQAPGIPITVGLHSLPMQLDRFLLKDSQQSCIVLDHDE